jgi:uncharacterized protein YprB with RNaseH-like and TPR domain
MWAITVQAVPAMSDPVVWGPDLTETALLRRLARFLREHTGPVITWNGASADLPALRAASLRTRQRAAVEQLPARHRDLMRWVDTNLCLPIIGLGLDHVADWLNIPSAVQIRNGLHAQGVWRTYQLTGERDLARQLVEYASGDVTKLVAVTQELHARVRTATSVTPLPEADRTRRRRPTPWWENAETVELGDLPWISRRV